MKSHYRHLLTILVICGLSAACEHPAPTEVGPDEAQLTTPSSTDDQPNGADEVEDAQPTDGETAAGPDQKPAKPQRCDELADLSQASKPAAGKAHPDFEAFRNEVKSLGTRRNTQVDRARWYVGEEHKETCAEWTGAELPKPKNWPIQGDCTIEFQLDGDAALIHQTTECGGDACTVRHFLWDSTKPAPVRLDMRADFAAVNIAPSKEVIVFDRQHVAPIERRMYLLDLENGRECLLTRECFSPRLAPDGQTIVCRNKKSDVLTVPITGGKPKLVEPAKLPPTHTTYSRSQWGEFPPPVEFVRADRVEYDVVMEKKPAGSGDVSELKRPLDWPPQSD